MIDLQSILNNGECLKYVVMAGILLVPLVYSHTVKTQVKAAKDIIKEKNEEIKRLNTLVTNYTQQLIDRNKK